MDDTCPGLCEPESDCCLLLQLLQQHKQRLCMRAPLLQLQLLTAAGAVPQACCLRRYMHLRHLAGKYELRGLQVGGHHHLLMCPQMCDDADQTGDPFSNQWLGHAKCAAAPHRQRASGFSLQVLRQPATQR